MVNYNSSTCYNNLLRNGVDLFLRRTTTAPTPPTLKKKLGRVVPGSFVCKKKGVKIRHFKNDHSVLKTKNYDHIDKIDKLIGRI